MNSPELASLVTPAPDSTERANSFDEARTMEPGALLAALLIRYDNFRRAKRREGSPDFVARLPVFQAAYESAYREMLYRLTS